jgi:acetylornithine/LysW-gamma-L-lysine aminotransferase
MTDYRLLENQYGFNVYTKRDVVIVRGKNATVWDDQGREYIDCVGGHGSANLGHCNEKIVQALTEQAHKLITCPNILYNDVRGRFLEKLIGIMPPPLARAFLTNSGAESVEGAIKFARFTTKKTDFICAMRGFHGRTMGALSATFKPEYREDFKPLVPGFHHVPFNNFEKLEAEITNQTAAVLLEIIQGEGGIHIGDPDYFKNVESLCRKRNILFILDEVQTGFCRTGKMFAFQHFDLKPDILCLAKSIAGGVPMGAVVCSEKIEVPMGKHGTTFGGNPLTCAAGIAAIDFMIENELDKQVREKGDCLAQKLKDLNPEKVREIRQLGLMVGIELKEKAMPYILALIEQGVLTLPSGTTVIRLLPPLTIGYEELDIVAEKLREVLG